MKKLILFTAITLILLSLTACSSGDKTKISVGAAADIVSENLTDTVTFDVLSAEIVYSGISDNNSMSTKLCPVWKFKLFNPNDDLNYIVYVDAVNGDFSYMTISSQFALTQ